MRLHVVASHEVVGPFWICTREQVLELFEGDHATDLVLWQFFTVAQNLSNIRFFLSNLLCFITMDVFLCDSTVFSWKL